MPRVFVLAVAAVLLLAGCRVDATVDVDVSEGGGEVTARFRLDREAVAILGGAVAEGAQTLDLQQAGWEISPVDDGPDGGAEISARKEFNRPSDLGVVMAELAGPEGPLRDFRLDRHRSFLKARYRVRGTADLGPGGAAVTGFANSPDLPGRLRDAGVDADRVGQLLAGRAADGFGLRLVVELPGKTESWTLEPGSPPRTVDVASATDERLRLSLLVVAVLLATVGVFRLRRPRPQN